METQEEQSDGRSEQKVKISLPGEMIEDILSRLPVKSILQFRSVSKQWRSLISDPSFTKLHFNRSTTALFISAYDRFNRKRYFLSAAHDGGSVTHLATLDNVPHPSEESEHVNGLVCFTPANGFLPPNCVFVVNPSTHKFFKVPDSAWLTNRKNVYLFGFDEARNEHKILNITTSRKRPYTVEILIFSMSSYSWRKVNVELPIDFATDLLYSSFKRSVCVDSVIHFMLEPSFDILTFELRTEKFSKISAPKNIVPREITTGYNINGYNTFKYNHPSIIKINGSVGIVCHDRVVETNEMDIWILQDYESRVWVRETIAFPESWISLDRPFPSDSVNSDEIIFSTSGLSRNVISVPIYNMKTKCFKSVQLNHPLLRLAPFDQIKCYVESIVPL